MKNQHRFAQQTEDRIVSYMTELGEPSLAASMEKNYTKLKLCDQTLGQRIISNLLERDLTLTKC